MRVLRTLPISAGRLALVLMAIALLPVAAVGPLVARAAGLAWGTPAAILLLKTFVYILAPVALCIFMAVWRGTGVGTYAVQFITMFGFVMAPLWLQGFFHDLEMPLSVTVIFRVLCVWLAFLLTRRALRHGTRAYRKGVLGNPLGTACG